MATRGRKDTTSVLWVGGAVVAPDLVDRLAAGGVVVRARALDADFATAAEALVADDSPEMIVCDCSGDRGYERAFFVCRAAPAVPVLLLAVGDDVDDRVAETLLIGVVKALPRALVALLTDRVDELRRVTAASAREEWAPEDLAGAILELRCATPFPTGSTLRLKNRAPMR